MADEPTLSAAARDYIWARMSDLGLGQNELAAKAGLDKSVLSRILRKRENVTLRTLQRLADALSVDVSVILAGGITGSGSATLPGISASATGSTGARGMSTAHSNINARPVEDVRSPVAVPLSIYRWGAAGDPTSPDDQPLPDREDYPPLGRESLIGPRGYGVEVRGNSMTNRRIHDGDVVWVNPDRPILLNKPVVAFVRNCRCADGSEEDGMVVKVLRRTEHGTALFNDGDPPHGTHQLHCEEFIPRGPVVLIDPAPFAPD